MSYDLGSQYNLRKRTHSLTKDNSSTITINPTPRKKAKESFAIVTPNKTIPVVKSSSSVRSKDRYLINKDNSSSKIDNEGDEELTHSTSSLSMEDYDNNIGSNSSSPLSSPPSSPNLENDYDDRDDVIEPLLLPNVVWVNDKEKGWWPSEIVSNDKSEKPLSVKLFGQKQLCMLELHDISKSNILPFRNELFEQLRKTGENSSMKESFNQAIAEAIERETEDNDGLPSNDFAFQMVVDSSPSNRKKKSKRKSIVRNVVSEKRTKGIDYPSASGKESSSKEKFSINQETSNLSDSDFGKDETLQIPGEYVLVSCQKKYYPAKIISYKEQDKYKVLYCDESTETVPRKKFFTKYEDGFKTCELGQFEMDREDPTYKEPELVKKIQSLEPILSRILRCEEDSWRFQHFCQGGKKLKLLASKVSPGPFNLSQFGLIARALRGIFIPEIAESIDGKNKICSPVKVADIKDVKDHEETKATKSSEDNKLVNIDKSNIHQKSYFESLSSDLKLRFVNDVLLSETIIRLIMAEEEIEYEEADRKMLEGYSETRWVEHLMAERVSFQMGSESLREKHE